jgi:hypothetical protein
MPSARFGFLTRRVAYLRTLFLPAVFSPTGDYARDDFDRVRGYRLLVHAEIESYIEDRTRMIVSATLNSWLRHHRPSRVLTNLLAFHLVQQAISKNQLKDVFTTNTPHTDDAAKSAAQAYFKLLSDNHGIREEHILRILLPLGIRTPDIDPAWLSTIDTFGRSRGETAHTSMKVQTSPDPATEFKTVTDIMSGLHVMDGTLSKL